MAPKIEKKISISESRVQTVRHRKQRKTIPQKPQLKYFYHFKPSNDGPKYRKQLICTLLTHNQSSNTCSPVCQFMHETNMHRIMRNSSARHLHLAHLMKYGKWLSRLNVQKEYRVISVTVHTTRKRITLSSFWICRSIKNQHFLHPQAFFSVQTAPDFSLKYTEQN